MLLCLFSFIWKGYWCWFIVLKLFMTSNHACDRSKLKLHNTSNSWVKFWKDLWQKKRQSSPSVVRLLHVTVFCGFTSGVNHSVRMDLFHWNVVLLCQFQCIVQVVKRRDVREAILVNVDRRRRKPARVCLWRQTFTSVYTLLKS